MQITKQEIEAIKQSNDLISVIKSRGIKLKKKGKSLVALCPFHKEKTPSFTVDPVKQLWNCFGCSSNGNGSTGGDVIGFVVKYDKVGFKEAIEKLGKEGSGEKQKSEARSKKSGETDNKILYPKKQKILKRVIEFYHTTFTEDHRGLKYLIEQRKITDIDIFRDFKIGFANGTLLNTLPDDGEVIDSLKQIGILNEKGNELFYGSVTFPIYDQQGNITTIYGRNIENKVDGCRLSVTSKSKKTGNRQPETDNFLIKHLYLPGERRGVFNWQCAKLNNEIILTESIIDSLSLYNAGFKNTIPCYGVNGLTPDHLTLFKRYNTKTIYLCFDPDETGRNAVKAIIPRLTALNISVYPVTLPEGHDINTFFSLTANPSDEFKRLLTKANPSLSAKEKEAIKNKKDTWHKTQHGFIVTYGGREYEIIGISRTETKLKATIKGIKTDKGKRRFHVDTVDFYSSRSRRLLTGGLTDLFGEDEGVITDDINKIMELIERYRETDSQKESDKPKEEMTREDKEEALRFLKNPDMFDEIIADFETAGYTGDITNKLLCYIAAISRKLETPLSIMIQSRSAAGKSFLQDTVLSLIPEQDFVKYTRLTDQSLFYKDRESLVHKILVIEELDGMNGAIYSIRSIQSSKRITIAYTGKDPMTGAMKTEENTVEGHVMVFITTTQVDIDGETASRFLFISLDESRTKTEKILEKQREKHTMEGLLNKLCLEKIIKKHHAANRLLRPLYVINPFSKLLTFTTRSLRVHREHDKYLYLISAIAYLFQYQREIKKMTHDGKEIEYVTVKIADIQKAHQIANELLGMSLDELSQPSRRLLLFIKEMVTEKCKEKDISPKEYRFSRREIREYTGWSDFQVKTHIKELEELEYLYSVSGKKGKEYVYELIYTGGGEDGSRFLIGLIPIEDLKKKAKKSRITH